MTKGCTIPGLTWKKPEYSTIKTLGTSDKIDRIEYNCSSPNQTITVASASYRKDYYSSGFLQILPDEQIQAQDELHRDFSRRKPSEQEFAKLKASGRFSPRILLLLKRDELFSFPVIENKQ